MSNIPDITSLSDLITTSPNQPASSSAPASDGVGFEPGLDLANSKIITQSTNEVQVPATQSPPPPDHHKDVVGSAANDLREVEKLLHKQQQKVKLLDTRDELLRSRSQLKDTVEDLRLKLKQLKALQDNRITKRKLDDYLQDNSEQFDNSATRLNLNDTTDDNDNDNNYILQHLHVLPSTNWDERLVLIKKFMPYLEFDSLSTESFHNGDKELMRIIKFTVISPLLFKFPIKVEVNGHHESIHAIIINRLSTTLSLLSPSFNSVLLKNYLPHKKINLIMFGLNSLSILLHKRINNLYKLVRKYATLISHNDNLQPLLHQQELNDNIKLFAILKSVNILEFRLPNHRTIRFHWEIELNDSITGECESKLELFIIDHTTNIQNKTSLLLNLIQRYGILNAIDTIIDKSTNV